ncbi:MAG: RNA methyltransferase [Gilvibacter sp.]
MIQISSTQNPRIKSLLLLKEKSRERKKTGTFVVEGVREIELAIKGGYKLDALFICPELADQASLQVANKLEVNQKFELSANVYNKIAHRGSTEGLVAIANSKDHSLAQLTFATDKPLILVAEAPEKPGNIGALLRTADAAGIDAVIIANPKSDLYNPNIIRSSVGCVFTTQIATSTSEAAIAYLKQNSIAIYSAALQDATDYLLADYSIASALVVGTEAQGLTNEWREQATKIISIPMKGQIDSMNVSVAAGILVFEANRQRRP